MKKLLGIFTVLVLVFTVSAALPIRGEAALYDSVIRLHVLAASDSEEDQALKLKVRDAVLNVTAPLLQDTKTVDEAQVILEQSREAIVAAAQGCLSENGSVDPVTVTLGKEEYPTKRYENLAFPAGEYLSLRVMIGEAQGQNWWCVLFPPLCLSAATTKSEAEELFLSAGLTPEQYRVITESDSGKYKLRFKILEVASSLFD